MPMGSLAAEIAKSPEALILDNHKKFMREASPSFRALNESGIKRFERLAFPHRKHEMFTFVNTGELAATPFELHSGGAVSLAFVRGRIYKECEKSFVTLVDGVYQKDLSDTSALGSSLKISTLEEALSNPAIEKYVRESVERENDVFASINSAFLSQGLVVQAPPKACWEVPLQILHVSTGSLSAPVTTTPRVLAQVGSLGEVKMIVKYVGLNGGYFVNSVLDVLLDEGARMAFTQTQVDAADSWHCSKVRVLLHRDSRFTAANASSGGKLVRHHYDICLKETGAEVQLNGVNILVGKEQIHHYIRIVHEAPQCASRIHFKNIVYDQGRSSVDGTVVVKKGAQLTQSDQLINNLLLSDDAHADSKPVLMIDADDVKCTHGNTVGQVDEEQIFYLRTRGLTKKAAQTLLTRSFAASILETIAFPTVREDLKNTLLKKLEMNHA